MMDFTKRKGFTLLEILIAITILGIITAVFPFHFNKISDVELLPTVEKIVFDLRWARLQAVLDNKDYYFRIYRKDDIYKFDDNSKNDYILYTKVGVDPKRINIIKEGHFSDDYILYKNKTPKLIKDDYYDRIKFTGFGTACNGTIGFESKDGRLIQIVVSQLGRIRIE